LQPLRSKEPDNDLLAAPELCDLNDDDHVTPLRLQFRADADAESALHDSADDLAITDVLPRVAQHRKPTAEVRKGRLLIAAMAAGAAAAAAHGVITQDAPLDSKTVLAAGIAPMDSLAAPSDGMQIVTVTPAAATGTHSEEFARGAAYAQERADREARLQRPLFVKPTTGIFTSGYGYRWGALHAGIDIAAPIGTPIYAVADGVVTDSGPTAGYGAWVKIRHSDGTVTLYGHVNSWLVSPGQRVFAGDQIATVGNRGQSTGPHCHFSVLANGTDFIDPQPWLAQRGVSVR
jgi:murein DD-endopeptidase MepM/ murein hydrolase activator NlpD